MTGAWRAWARLGRVSNLPTVWTNALAGVVFSFGALQPAGFAWLCLGLSLVYVAGMVLNDAFDAKIDAALRADRPIPRGEVSREAAFAVGGGLLVLGVGLLAALEARAAPWAVALGGAVVLYDWAHKRTALSPLIMASCRALVALTAAAFSGGAMLEAGFAAFGLAAYTAGLTYAAKQEAHDRIGSIWPLFVLAAPLGLLVAFAQGDPLALGLTAALALWMGAALRRLWRRAKGDVPKAVVALIAGMSLYDAALIAASGLPLLAAAAVLGFGLTLAGQRFAPGT